MDAKIAQHGLSITGPYPVSCRLKLFPGLVPGESIDHIGLGEPAPAGDIDAILEKTDILGGMGIRINGKVDTE